MRVNPPYKVSAHIDVQFACQSAGDITSAAEVKAWTVAALGRCDGHQNLTVRFVDESEGADLNQRYRQSSGPTNVLSFPYEPSPGGDETLLGDIAVCTPVVLREAREQDKTVQAHCAHLVVHATLHLLGYDHQTEEDAKRMESEEVAILSRLGFSNPYAPVAP